MPLLEDVANRMAARTLRLIEETGDEDLEKKVADQIGASSPTLQEAFTTALRILKAEHRAAQYIEAIEAKAGVESTSQPDEPIPAPPPSPAPEAAPEPAREPEPAPQAEPEPVPEPDIDFETVTLADEFDDEEDEEELIALPSPTPGRSKGRKTSRALSRLPDL